MDETNKKALFGLTEQVRMGSKETLQLPQVPTSQLPQAGGCKSIIVLTLQMHRPAQNCKLTVLDCCVIFDHMVSKWWSAIKGWVGGCHLPLKVQ